MDHSKEAAIRARAYQLWVESGYAEGYHELHWRQAEREVAAREGAGSTDDEPPSSPGRIAGQPSHHTDGLSPFPSVLDPGPHKTGG